MDDDLWLKLKYCQFGGFILGMNPLREKRSRENCIYLSLSLRLEDNKGHMKF